ncbi:MAG: C10 family peptidase [Bacteroidales bacterium]|nr:C10 family peptidase [Bacteroidales bacterium]
MMKKIVTSALGILLFLSVLFAEPVTEQKAKEMALAFVAGWYRPVEAVIGEVSVLRSPDGTSLVYAVQLEEKGWVLVSADDVVQPVLAFSFDNPYLPEEEWTDGARYLLTGYKEQIASAIRDKTLKKHPGWTLPEFPVETKAAQVTIDPFIDVTWNQGNGWNRFCPADEEGPGGHAYVGCVAVSMAQAMTVYNYPVQAQGSNAYTHEKYGYISLNFDKQDPYEWPLMSSSTSDDYNARLLYHCAVSVNMDFGPDGSGAYTRNAAGAMKTHFGYSATTKLVQRYSDEEAWKNLLIDELSGGRPIIYSGSPGDGTAGHAWNIDGYANGYFHMNFGWSGSQNGYFSLDLINPASYDFSEDQDAIVGIRPPQSLPYDIHLSELTIQEDLPAGTFVATIKVDDEDPENVYSFSCLGPFNIFTEGRDISLLFYIENDTLWTSKILEYNSENSDLNNKNILIRVVDQYFNKFEKEFDIEVTENPSSSTAIENRVRSTLSVYPNPAENYFILSNGYRVPVAVTLYTLTGTKVFSGPSAGRVDVPDLDAGMYILEIKSEYGTETGKIIIRQ